MMAKLTVSVKSPSFPYGALIFAHYLNVQNKAKIDISILDTDMPDAVFQVEKTTISGTNHVLRHLARSYDMPFYSASPLYGSQTDHWLDYSADHLFGNDFKKFSSAFDTLNHYLKMRSYFVGYSVRLADIAVWGALRGNPIFMKQLKSPSGCGTYLARWYNHIGSLEYVVEALTHLEKSKEALNKQKKDQGSFDIGLKNAEYGKVVTRFPPEPSGYLHIGHAKAALLNDYFARQYGGRLIVRFDDTNPSKEKEEFESSIKEDLSLLGIKGDVITHTSDYFDKLYEFAIDIIKRGLAYVDDTEQETMRAQRMDGIESKNRNISVEDNLKLFKEMFNGTEIGLKCCLRAKINMQEKNKALRDPVIYRCNLTPHIKTGNKWKIYPTYDFACPIVDSIEGVTHALRTNEYRDRNAQYEWFLKALDLRWVNIWDYSRMNFVYTLLSKRKLTWFVEQGLVSGWDDPRFPTVRGIRRRGMTIDALRTYILMQGASQKDLMLEWDKIWVVNKKVIDPIAARHTALVKENLVQVNVIEETLAAHTKTLPLHKKNPDVGNKETTFATSIWLEQEDAKQLNVDEEFTLMDWGNAFVKAIKSNAGGFVESMDITLNLEGDFKKTKLKLTWLANIPPTNNANHTVVEVKLMDYDYLITKKKLEDEDEIKDFITPVTEFTTVTVGDANLRKLKKGDIIQFERKGYYICDKAFTSANEPMVLLNIPDGKASSMQSKAAEGQTASSASNNTANAAGQKSPIAAKKEKSSNNSKAAVSGGTVASSIKMYKSANLYGRIQQIDPKKVSKMYAVKPILHIPASN